MIDLNDFEIRKAYRAEISNQTHLLIDEFDLNRGAARVDLVQFGDHIIGYEIKSDKDNLSRLAKQAENYNRALEKIVIITGYKHKNKVVEQIPSWWGIVEAKRNGDKIHFDEIREPEVNPYFDPSSLLDLLWKSELINILGEYGFRSNFNSKSKFELKNLLKNIALYKELKSYTLKFLSLRECYTLVDSPV